MVMVGKGGRRRGMLLYRGDSWRLGCQFLTTNEAIETGISVMYIMVVHKTVSPR